MSARHLFFQQAAELHLQSVRAGRKAEMQIEKAMVYRFQRQRKSQPAIGLRARLRRCCRRVAALHLLTWAKPVIERMGIGACVILQFCATALGDVRVGELQFVETAVRA